MSDLRHAREWPGVTCTYVVALRGDGVGLDISFAFDPAVVPDEAGQAQNLHDQYGLICDQFGTFDASCRLMAPSLTAAIDTAATLAAAPIEQDAGGTPLVTLIGGFLCHVRNWIAARRDGRVEGIPQLTIALSIDRGYPRLWSGDLLELAVSLTLTRTVGAVKSHASTLRRSVTTRVEARRAPASDADRTGLSAFAAAFEDAYGGYDGGSGRLKIATGVNSDAAGAGQASVWAMRWGSDHGASLTVRNDDRHPVIFYAPLPLNTRMLTRRVDRLRRYSDAASGACDEISQVFSGVDIDRWAEAFLQTVDAVDDDALSAVKRDLAAAIAGTIDFVYDRGAGDRSAARETLRQVLVDILSHHYRLSALAQLTVTVHLHEAIKPGGDRSRPPHLAGRIDSSGAPSCSTPGIVRLPLRQGGAFLTVPVAAADPAAACAIDLDPVWDIGFIEPAIQPSSPLTFVLPRDARSPDGNTLTVSIGRMSVPVPLRVYPSPPALVEASAEQDTPPDQISSLTQALTWRYSMTMTRPHVAQDTLIVQIVFNELMAGGSAASAIVPSAARVDESRPGPADLYDALARYTFESPQLLPHLSTVDGGDAKSNVALARFIDLAVGVAGTWAAWQPPEPSNEAPPPPDGAQEIWTYALDQDEDGKTLRMTASSMRAVGAPPVWQPLPGQPPWPEIQGYTLRPEGNGKQATYVLSAAAAPADLAFSWDRLFVLGYQSARGQAWIERNRNLAPPGQLTNPRFGYRSSVSSLQAQVPLVRAASPIAIAPLASLEAALQAVLLDLRTAPAGSHAGAGASALRVAYNLSYSFSLASPDMRASLPLSHGRWTIDPGKDGVLAAEIAGLVSDWKRLTNPSLEGARVSLDLTVFAPTSDADGPDRPLAQLSQIDIAASADPAWWTVAASRNPL